MMLMYEYDYERVEVNLSNWQVFGGFVREPSGYRDVIRRWARKGWRFITWIPVTQKAEGIIDAIDLVFEKEKKQD